jgi:ribosome biogenesis GTPase / thiamine phosphate phosphatase
MDGNPEITSQPKGFVDGVVIRSTGSWYDVMATDRIIPSTMRGRFRLTAGNETNPVVVGDRVTVRLNADDTGLITQIHKRSRSLLRRAAGRKVGRAHVIATNVDFAWVVQSVSEPRFNPGFVDRFLVMAALNDLPAGVVFNKCDLARAGKMSEVLKRWRNLYEDRLGYPVVSTSARSGKGIEKLRGLLGGKTSVMSGPSGVGKSTILNAMSPGLGLRTGAISASTGKGIHTTTNASLHRIESGGFVVDTPGLREYGLIGLDPGHLSHYFVEMKAYIPNCRFPNCTHDHEPGCAVKDAVDDGRIDIQRYDSYLGMLYSLRLGYGDVGR